MAVLKEQAIQTVKQVLKKCKTEVEVTLALLAYHDTPVSNESVLKTFL